MPRPWTVLETVDTPEGALSLMQRGARDFMIRHAGRVLMTSAYHRSEVAVAELACERIRDRERAQVLIGGAGLGYTLRAALDGLGRDTTVTVAELNPVVLRWCQGPLTVLTDNAIGDPRTRTVVGDVMAQVRQPPRAGYDAIIIDLYIGPDDTGRSASHPVYGDQALASVHGALSEGGVYAVWGEEPSPRFERRLARAGFEVSSVRTRGPGPHHVIFLGKALPRSRARS